MKVWGLLSSHEIVVLVDSEASDSFIATKLVQELDISCEATTRLGVQVGNSFIATKFFPFELGSVAMVLEVTWLHTLGEVRADWNRFTMCFL